MPIRALGQIAEEQLSSGDPFQYGDLMIDGFAHFPDLAVAPLMDCDFYAAIFFIFFDNIDLRGRSQFAVYQYAASEPVQLFGRRFAEEAGYVYFIDIMLRVR